MPHSTYNIIDLRRERRTLVEEAQRLIVAAESESRDLTPEESQRCDAIHEDGDNLLTRIERMERQLDAERTALDEELEPRRAVPDDYDPREGRAAEASPDDSPDDSDRSSRRSLTDEAFEVFCRRGLRYLSAGQRQALDTDIGRLPEEIRALATSTDSAGGATIPEGFLQRLEEAMLAFGGINQSRSERLETDSGANLPYPTADDTSNEGVIIAESAPIAEDADPVFGNIIFKSYMYSSKIVLVPIQLLQDSAFNLGAWLSSKLGVRIARILNRHRTVGDGVGKPTGIVTASPKGADAAAAAALTGDDFLDLKHSVDPAHRMPGIPEWMYNDLTLKVLKKLTVGAADARPLWKSGVALREPDTVDGDPYVINQHMPSVAANQKSVIYGDLSKYLRRDIRGAVLFKFEERYMHKLQKGFMAFSRHDGNLVDAGSGPVKHLLHPAA